MTKTRIKAIELKIYHLLRDYGQPLSRTDIAERLGIAPSTVGEALKRIDQELPNAFIEKVGRSFQIVRKEYEFTNDEFYLLSQIVAASDLISVEQAKALLEKIRSQSDANVNRRYTDEEPLRLYLERVGVRSKGELQKANNLNELIANKKAASFEYEGMERQTIPLKLVLANGHVFLIAAPLLNKRIPKIDAGLMLSLFLVDEISCDIRGERPYGTWDWREAARSSAVVERKIKEIETKLIESI